MKRIALAVIVTCVLGAVVAVLAISSGRSENDPVLERWAQANRQAVTLIARDAHVEADQVGCGQYGGYVREASTCSVVRDNGQCEKWRYDVRAGRRDVSRMDRGAVPAEPPGPEARILICFF